MAIRKDAFSEIGLFRTDLGIGKMLPLRNDDTEIVGRLFSFGKRIAYTPKATVHHKVPAKRMRMSYLRSWTFFTNLGLIRMSPPKNPTIPRWLIKESMEIGLSALRAYVQKNKLLGMEQELLFWERLGRIVGTLVVRRGPS